MINLSPDIEHYSILFIFFSFFIFFLVVKFKGNASLKDRINLFFNLYENDEELSEEEVRVNNIASKLMEHTAMIYIGFIIAGAIWWIGGN